MSLKIHSFSTVAENSFVDRAVQSTFGGKTDATEKMRNFPLSALGLTGHLAASILAAFFSEG